MTAFATGNANPGFSAQMNITPLVDVMLVLLVIFMLAVPLTTQRLPLTNSPPCSASCTPGEPIRLAIKCTGELYWNGAAVNRAQLAENLGTLSRQSQAPVLQLHPESGTHYALVAQVLAAARNADVNQVSVAPIVR